MAKLSKKAKIILFSLITVAAIFVAVLSYGVWSLYSTVSYYSNRFTVPPELNETGVKKGEETFSKTEIFKLKKLGYWNMMLKSITIRDEKERQKFTKSEVAKGIYNFSDLRLCGNEVVAVGEFGAYIFNQNLELKQEILFEPIPHKIKVGSFEKENYDRSAHEPKIVQLTKETCGFLSVDSMDGVTIFDITGTPIWQYGERQMDIKELWDEKSEEDYEKESWITETAVADLDDDGTSEYIVSKKNDGIHAFDREGKERWFQQDEFSTSGFHVTDLDGDGTKELFEFQGKNSAIRDKKNGAVIKKIQLDGNSDDFLFDNFEEKPSTRFLSIYANQLKLRDFNNKILLETDAPLSEIVIAGQKEKPSATPIYSGNQVAMPVDESNEPDTTSVYRPKAIWVKSKKDKTKYLAVIASFIGIPRSNIYIYESNGNLIYHELLPEDAETISVLSQNNGDESILIGGKDTIWKFDMRQ